MVTGQCRPEVLRVKHRRWITLHTRLDGGCGDYLPLDRTSKYRMISRYRDMKYHDISISSLAYDMNPSNMHNYSQLNCKPEFRTITKVTTSAESGMVWHTKRYNVDTMHVRYETTSGLDWPYELWPWMTLNCPSSRSLQLHVRYFNNDVWNATALGRYMFHWMYFLLTRVLCFHIKTVFC